MYYVLIKLVTGEELVGISEIPGPDCGYFNIENPHLVKMSYDTNGNFGINIFPFMWSSEDKLFTFKERDVILWTSPNETLCKYYDSYVADAEDQITNKPVNAISSDLLH